MLKMHQINLIYIFFVLLIFSLIIQPPKNLAIHGPNHLHI